MTYFLFFIVGSISAIHVYSYGCWLKKNDNISGFILSLLLALLAFSLPLFSLLRR